MHYNTNIQYIHYNEIMRCNTCITIKICIRYNMDALRYTLFTTYITTCTSAHMHYNTYALQHKCYNIPTLQHTGITTHTLQQTCVTTHLHYYSSALQHTSLTTHIHWMFFFSVVTIFLYPY